MSEQSIGNDNSIGPFFVGFGLALIIMIPLVGSIASYMTARDAERAAIKHKAASWQTDEHGNPTFKWNDEK